MMSWEICISSGGKWRDMTTAGRRAMWRRRWFDWDEYVAVGGATAWHLNLSLGR
jgi:hypothetical protein